ncbi:MAG: tRNA epoxyqueuosine(34) reductase QueG [Chthoniobacterales bacterium]|nr:tRNA epoxyqueuosine(34) reductase QueG [Chthoniobacterales bacterium]
MKKEELLEEARLSGFDQCGVARAGPAPHATALESWLQNGDHGTMEWMRRTAPERSDPRRLLPGASSVVVLATNYYRKNPEGRHEGRGKVARYAWGADYHDVIGPRLRHLAEIMGRAGGEQKCFIDGGPVLERDWAAACGISWHGKSTMGIHPRLGTWFFLSVILTTLEFEPDPPLPDRCGSCTRCIVACPTNAIDRPHHLDARRCISYLTIENKGPIPAEFREAMGDRIFGCDDCLDACPWNRFAVESRDAQLAPSAEILRAPLREFLALDEAGFKTMFRGSPILRAKRRGFLRNVCVALGNKGTADDLPALRAAAGDAEPLVREHAEWAIARIGERATAGHQPRSSTESR